MNVAEMTKWLSEQDQEAEVQVVVVAYNSYGCSAYFESFYPEVHAEYTDMRGNPFAKGKTYENDRTLYLGTK